MTFSLDLKKKKENNKNTKKKKNHKRKIKKTKRPRFLIETPASLKIGCCIAL